MAHRIGGFDACVNWTLKYESRSVDYSRCFLREAIAKAVEAYDKTQIPVRIMSSGRDTEIVIGPNTVDMFRVPLSECI